MFAEQKHDRQIYKITTFAVRISSEYRARFREKSRNNK